ENFDFAKDLFPSLMKEGIELIAGHSSGYWRDVGNPDSYREVHEDIMSGRVNFPINLKKTIYPDGVLYCDDIPNLGDGVEIIGKVILGNNVTIGARSKIKDIVIGNSVNIGEDNKITNSVIWDNVHIDKGIKIDNGVICNNNIISKNSKMTAGIILAEGCQVGELVTVEKDVTIWPERDIESASIVSSNLILGNRYKNSIFENGIVEGQSNIELSCEMVTKLAEAFGAQLPIGSNILIGRDHHPSSRMLKRAFVGGMLSAGVNVVNLKSIPSSILRFNLSRNNQYDAGIYFEQNREDTTVTKITFFNSDALRINSEIAKKIEKAYFKETFRRVDFSQIGIITDGQNKQECIDYTSSMESIYQKRLFSCVDCRVAIDVMHGSASQVFPDILNKLSIDNMIFNNYHDAHHLANFKSLLKRSTTDIQNIVKGLGLDAGFLLYPYGQRLDIICNNGELLSMKNSLQVVLTLLDMEASKEGRKKVFLPTWAPDITLYEHLDIERGKYSDFKAEELKEYDLIATVDGNFAFTEFSLYRDSMYATIKILELIIKHNVKLSDIVSTVELFYYKQTKIDCSQALKGKMMRMFLEDTKDKKSSTIDGVKIWLNKSDWILMIPDQYSDHLNIYIQALDKESGDNIYDIYSKKIEEWSKN
ncbi:MAG: mannose-1-phosphate guanyltransferase, partial [Sulfurovum sp.]|nr:mannose-1-phosphate guanyltransferase [Sulfurovaceae bacterium]